MPLDPDAFREEKGGDLKKIKQSQEARGKPDTDLEDLLALDDQWRKKRFEVDEIQKKKNKLDKNFREAPADQKPTLAEESKKLKAAIAQGEEEADELLRKRDIALGVIGNLVHESVPVSKDEKDNEVKWTWGKTEHTGNEMSHHEVLHRIGGADLEKGVVVAGHRGYFLKGWGVRLNQALISYGLDFLREYKYTEVQPPFFMRKEVMAETAQLEEFDEALYKVVGNKSEDGKSTEEFYLIATSEQPISALHRGDVLEDKDLPLRYAGISSCFRKEAGSHGKDTWGIFRIHQFEKVEQFCITTPEKSWEMHEEMIGIARKFYENLGLSYRVVAIVSGELNNAAAKKYDLEAWFPHLQTFRELVSASNCTDYQSRAMGTKYGFKKQGREEKNKFVHMLNATLCATERTICCILENYQRENGVEIPKVLQKYMNAEFIPYTRERPVNKNQIKQDRAAEKKGKGGKDKGAKSDGAADVKDEKPAGKGKNKGGNKDNEAKSDAPKDKEAPKEEGKKGGKGGKKDSQNAPKDAAPKTEESPKSAEPKQESGKKGGKGKNKGGNKLEEAPKEEAPKAAPEESKPAEQGKGKGKKQSQQKEAPKETEKLKEEAPKTEAKEQGGSKKNKGNKQQSKGSDTKEAPKAAETKPEDSPKKEEGGKGGKGKNKQGGGKPQDKPKVDAGSVAETQTPRKDSAAAAPAKKGESGKKEESKKAESTPKKEEPKPEAKDTKPAEPKQESGKKEQPKQGGGNQQQGGGSGKKKNKKK